MEKMFEMMLKSMGFNPADMKANIVKAAEEFKLLKEQLNRIEEKQDEIIKRNLH